MKNTHKTVLIIEDSPAQALALESLLREEGLEVLWAPDGKAGVLKAQEHTPDAILLDIEMPEMDGFEACKRLKHSAQTADIPIVMLTVRDDTATALHSIDLGAIDFVPKDAFCGPILLETLRQLHILPRSENPVQVTEGDWMMANE
jgi:DNA-binding response OmpR family regulator